VAPVRARTRGRLRSRVQQEDGRTRLDRDDVGPSATAATKSALERYVVLEEMLAAGAPVSAH
jgi:hypothetical protein